MTVLDPTPDLRLKLAEERAGDFAWAFDRLVEIMIERMKRMPPTVALVVSELVNESFGQLHQENLERQARRNEEA